MPLPRCPKCGEDVFGYDLSTEALPHEPPMPVGVRVKRCKNCGLALGAEPIDPKCLGNPEVVDYLKAVLFEKFKYKR